MDTLTLVFDQEDDDEFLTELTKTDGFTVEVDGPNLEIDLQEE